jgi:hypothetical protein
MIKIFVIIVGIFIIVMSIGIYFFVREIRQLEQKTRALNFPEKKSHLGIGDIEEKK